MQTLYIFKDPLKESLSVLGESSLLIVAERGLAFLATYNVLSRKLFSRVSMAVSSVVMLKF